MRGGGGEVVSRRHRRAAPLRSVWTKLFFFFLPAFPLQAPPRPKERRGRALIGRASREGGKRKIFFFKGRQCYCLLLLQLHITEGGGRREPKGVGGVLGE